MKREPQKSVPHYRDKCQPENESFLSEPHYSKLFFILKKCFVIKLYGDHFVLIKYYNPLICEDFFGSLVLLPVLNMDIMKLTLHLGVIIIKV